MEDGGIVSERNEIDQAQGVEVAPADLPELGPSVPPGSPGDLRVLSEVPLQVTVELGRAMMRVRNLLALREGSVIELDRAPGSPVDVFVNGRLVARGDVVVVDEEFGVRVTEVLDPRGAEAGTDGRAG
jgi:flagellar motor switch protein FliN/FliY